MKGGIGIKNEAAWESLFEESQVAFWVRLLKPNYIQF